MKCAVNGCTKESSLHNIYGFCFKHMQHKPTSVNSILAEVTERINTPNKIQSQSMSAKYPKYYKPIPKDATELDIYAVCQMFNVTDAAITHSLKKLMLPGVRTGGKSRRDDIKEARDTLNRWLELNPE